VLGISRRSPSALGPAGGPGRVVYTRNGEGSARINTHFRPYVGTLALI
jgi:hypothetical protein